MRYIVDHDMHIHSGLSKCSNDSLQTKERILEYAVQNNFKKVVVTNHFWDSAIKNTHIFYNTQDYEHIAQILPLPQTEGISFEFGCETDMDKEMNIGLHHDKYNNFDFIIVPTTHFHMYVDKETSVEKRAEIYIRRFERFLESDLPFYKTGIAHLTCPHIASGDWEAHLKVIDLVSDKQYEHLFSGAKEIGCGIELNIPIFKYSDEDLKRVLRPYIIAKECGCKFYFGSDAHHPNAFESSKKGFEHIVDLLSLKEEDKFLVKNKQCT